MSTSRHENQVMVAPGIVLPAAELHYSFSRSSGPGGQHVNKTSTRVTLRVQLEALRQILPSDAIARLPTRYLSEDALAICSSVFRSQTANRLDCLQKLIETLRASLCRPRQRQPTRPTRRSVQRRLDHKDQRSQLKHNRRIDRRPPNE